MPVPQLKFIRALWGAEGQYSTDINVLFAEIHRLGYAGIEATLKDVHRLTEQDPDAFHRALRENHLEFVGLIQTNYPTVKDDTWQDLSIDQHVNNIEYHLNQFLPYEPIHVNIQGGQDSWSIEENEQFFEQALQIQSKFPTITCSHEVNNLLLFNTIYHISVFQTHRTRSLYNPYITFRMVKRFPNLRLTADYSHFVLVCERLLVHETDEERFRLFASRVDHLHARVGTAQHAQITDPNQAKNECEVMQHWWEMIWNAQKDRQWITVVPEYGPAPYAMTSDIDVWKLTNQEMERQKKNYEKWSNTVDEQ